MQGRMNGLMWMDITVVWMNAYVCVDECVYVYTHPSIHPPTHPAIHPPVQAQPYIYIYIYTHTHYFTCIFTYTILKRDHMVRRLAVPGPPPCMVWSGRWGGGAGVCGNGRGPLELPLDGGVVLGGRPGLTCKSFASRKPCNVARAQ